MLTASTLTIARAYWASHFGCSADDLFSSSLRLISHRGELAHYSGVVALFRGGGGIASIPADRGDALRGLLSALPANFSPNDFAVAMRPVASAVIGPAFVGYADTVPAPSHPARALTINDSAAVDALRSGCSDVEWDHGGSLVGESPTSGIFVGNDLVALAGYETWGGTIAHIAVVTHSAFRGRGFGRSAVAHLAARALATGLLPQYRTLEANRASMRVGESLGFAGYATSIAVRLVGEG